jgi:hypothetical protein
MKHNKTQWFSQALKDNKKRVERGGKKGMDFGKKEEIRDFSFTDPDKMKLMLGVGGGGEGRGGEGRGRRLANTANLFTFFNRSEKEIDMIMILTFTNNFTGLWMGHHRCHLLENGFS